MEEETCQKEETSACDYENDWLEDISSEDFLLERGNMLVTIFTRMLSSATTSMDPVSFAALPCSTNAVESLHQATEQKYPDTLKVALMTAYEVDMARALEHIAAKKLIPTSYERLTPDVRAASERCGHVFHHIVWI